MPSTTSYRQGDIVLVSFPFTDLSSTKRRPAVVVSPDSFNARKQDLTLVAITSQIGDDPHIVLLEDSDFRDGRLPRRSVVKLTKLFTIHSSLIVKRICTVKREKMDEVLKGIRDFLS
jgi:mRNA-degrading endonuclease toxin of MazEF toxin-antitoxin module